MFVHSTSVLEKRHKNFHLLLLDSLLRRHGDNSLKQRYHGNASEYGNQRTCSLRLETSSTAPVCGCPGNRIPAAPTAAAVGKPMKGTVAAKSTTQQLF